MERDLRLRRNEDFQRLRREGRAFRHRLVTLSLAPNRLPHNRYGIVAGKVIGKAVIRNRLKRQVREVCRLLHPALKTGYDIVLITRQPLAEQPYADMQRIVTDLFAQAGMIVES